MPNRKEVTHSIGSVELEKKAVNANIEDYFGINTFSEAAMRKMISERTFNAFKKWQSEGIVITPAQADEIADAMKEWAIAKGAISYTHWFQPMTDLTAEKHDSFIVLNGTGQVLERFSGSKLIQGEPDASSFPSGGLRVTFEARGYTAWDPSSPAFIMEVELGKTLCIPSIFISYTGEALDKKLPLLRSEAALNKAARELLSLFGDTDAQQVYSTCGPEQEYFLIDKGYYRLRPDLQLTGRTLIGAPSPKGQQLEDHYFGSIKDRMLNYMNEVAEQAYRLGIPLTTRHNEVAPHQYEFAPFFERSNIAADHNLLLMDIMRRVAGRHGLECLLHEKPFAGVNGSGKHLNWSLMDNHGNNLLDPGDNPEKNLLFLTVLVAVVNAVHRHADLLRVSVASAGNEHRLGAHEAPPAIISVYLGTYLTKIFDNIENGEKIKTSKNEIIKLGVSHLPHFIRDSTDRNRTSPFAFTGTKFEFRALGSSFNISTGVTVINTIVAESFFALTARIKKRIKRNSFPQAVLFVLSEIIKECRPIIFNGNNYSEEWKKEAGSRRLPNEPSTPLALKTLIAAKNISLFERFGIFSRSEVEARYCTRLDLYNKTIEIEGRTLLEMVQTQILPAAYEFQIEVGNSLDVLKEMACDETIPIPVHAVDDRKEMFAKLSADIYYIRKDLRQLSDILKQAGKMDVEHKALFFFEEIKPLMSHIRSQIDDLESIMPDDMWLLPKYREMLFIN